METSGFFLFNENANLKAPRDRNVTTSVISVSQNDKIRHFDLITEIRV
jgi:hypothetical protein